MYKVISILMIILICGSIHVYAEDGSVLMMKYGLPVDNPVLESEKLDSILEEYREVAHEVNTNTMLSAAYDVYDQYSKSKLTAMDLEIYTLTDSLTAIELLMNKSKEREVDFLIDLDLQYRSIMVELKLKRELRAKFTEQFKKVVVTPDINPDKDTSKLNSLSHQVDIQKDKYNNAISYPDLGDITHFKSPLEIPVVMTSPFGERLDPLKRELITFHKGMDMNASIGTTVLAAFNGTIKDASYNSEIGNYVIIDHGHGITTLYGHLDSYQVAKGQKVTQYEPIAKSGNSGTETTGAHLHFGFMINGVAYDPGLFVPH